MKIKDLKHILSGLDSEAEIKIATCIDGQVIIDTVEKVNISFSGLLLQGGEFMAELKERYCKIEEQAEQDRPGLKIIK